jgi:hypothetical protein
VNHWGKLASRCAVLQPILLLDRPLPQRILLAVQIGNAGRKKVSKWRVKTADASCQPAAPQRSKMQNRCGILPEMTKGATVAGAPFAITDSLEIKQPGLPAL